MVIKKFNRSESAQKFMQVGIDVKCMHTDFGGRGLSGFGDFFQNLPFGPLAIVHEGQKIELAQKKSDKLFNECGLLIKIVVVIIDHFTSI